MSLGQLLAVLPFVVCNSLQALPHPTSVGAGVVLFDLSPVSMLCLFDGSSEGIAGFLIKSNIVSIYSPSHCNKVLISFNKRF